MVLDTSIDSSGLGGGPGAAAVSSGGGEEVSLSMPRKSAHDVYLIHAFNTMAKFNQIVFSLSGTTDPRVVPYTRQCINLVLDDNIRNAMHTALRKGLSYLESSVDLGPEQKGALQIELCQIAVGEVSSYLDEYIGLAKTNAVVPIASDPTPAEIAATKDILGIGGDIDAAGEEETDPDKARMDPETTEQPLGGAPVSR